MQVTSNKSYPIAEESVNLPKSVERKLLQKKTPIIETPETRVKRVEELCKVAATEQTPKIVNSEKLCKAAAKRRLRRLRKAVETKIKEMSEMPSESNFGSKEKGNAKKNVTGTSEIGSSPRELAEEIAIDQLPEKSLEISQDGNPMKSLRIRIPEVEEGMSLEAKTESEDSEEEDEIPMLAGEDNSLHPTALFYVPIKVR